MNRLFSFARLIQWWKSLAVFARPVSLIPGIWTLFEYYTEPGSELINFKEEQLKKDSKFWEIEFSENRELRQNSNLSVHFMENNFVYNWRLAGNYLKIFHSGDTHHYEEFQYAVERNLLKLLKKDKEGRIVFFGFFKKEHV
ncbi:MAG: hypothetical protein PHH93_12825 [Prolixibacteraceae bacterium]|nr:hypothetical protein [Prolixibacteraceae bacterium]